MIKSIFILFLLFTASVYSQSPDWSVNASSYQYNMTFTVFLNVDGTMLTNVNDKVGAFVNGENRGEATVVYNSNAKKYVAYLSVVANTVGETINFKIYDSTNNAIVDVVKTEVFEINKNIGGAFQSYSIAKPTLSSQAVINSFSFDGITLESNSIVNKTILIEVASEVDITSLTPVFTTESNSKVYLNKVLQVSGSNTLDFTNDVVFEVLSEDESQNSSYTIRVKKVVNTSDNDITFSDATYVFNGTEKFLSIAGTLPNGTTVMYSNNGLTNVGSKQVTATISGANFQELVLTASLTISPAIITGVTFSDANSDYDGSEKSILIEGIIPSGTELNYVSNSRTAAGVQEVFALISGDNYVNVVLKAVLTIRKASFNTSFTFNNKSFIFDGSSKSIAITENLPIDASIVYVNNDKTDSGIHEVLATISKVNYEDLVLKANLTITKARFNGFSFLDKSFIFDDTQKSIAITGNLPKDTTVSYTNNNLINVGIHEVIAIISGKNHKDLILKANLTITKATLSGFTFIDTSFVYNGEIKSIAIIGDLPTGVSVSYTNNNLTEVGVHEVTATISGGNYKDLVLKASVTITKNTLGTFTFTNRDFVFDGMQKSITILECLPTGTSVSYTNNSATNTGLYEVTATISGNNYENLILKATLRITEATLNGFAFAGKSFVYDSTSKSIVISGALPSNTSVSYIGNNQTETGEYEVVATISGANYKDLILKANLTITKATLSGYVFENKSFVYDEKPKTLIITGNLPTGTSVSYTNNNKLEAGIYEVAATISKPNYLDLILKAVLSISKADQVISFEPIVLPSDKNEFTLTATISSNLEIVYTSSNISVAKVSGSTISLVDSGVTIITASQPGNVNYNVAENKSQELIFSTLTTNGNFILNKSIVLYPNPVKLKVKLKTDLQEALEVSIFDATGKQVKKINNYQSEKDIDVSLFTAGNYFIKIKDATGKTTVKRFIKL